MSLPTEDKDRKALPIWTGCIMYFPDVWAEIAKVSKIGNDQHNPGEPLHWSREKSTDQMNTAVRHMLDHSSGNVLDVNGEYHLAKAIWRLSAELQLTIEKRRKDAKPEKPDDLPRMSGADSLRKAVAEESKRAGLTYSLKHDAYIDLNGIVYDPVRSGNYSWQFKMREML